MALTAPEKSIVHELTMAYVEQSELFKCRTNDIEERVAKVAEISQIIATAVEKQHDNFKWL